MTPDWYDLLDVPRDADGDTIRAAWKAAIADLDPTDRSFRVYSQAAEVLLDPAKRAAYDAQLAAEEEAEEPAPAAEATATEPATGAPAAGAPAPAAPATAAPAMGRRNVPGWLLLGLALLTLVAGGVAAGLHLTGDRSLGETLAEVAFWNEERAAADETQEAIEAAEAAVGPLLGYDYRRLDEDFAEAERHMTPEFREDYESIYSVIRANAADNRAVVTVTGVVASALGRTHDDGTVDVLLFFDRSTTNRARSRPVVTEDQATFTMKQVDGRWLVHDMKTTPASG